MVDTTIQYSSTAQHSTLCLLSFFACWLCFSLGLSEEAKVARGPFLHAEILANLVIASINRYNRTIWPTSKHWISQFLKIKCRHRHGIGIQLINGLQQMGSPVLSSLNTNDAGPLACPCCTQCTVPSHADAALALRET